MPFIAPLIGAVVGLVGAVGSFIGGLGIVGSIVVGAGLSVGLGYLQQMLADKPDDNGSQSSVPGGVNFQRQYGENVSRKVACGYVGIAGHDTYVNTFEKANYVMQQIYTLSDYYTSGLSRISIDGEWQSLGADANPDYGYPVVTGPYANRIFVRFYDGRQTVADNILVYRANPSGRWSNDCVGLGMSHVIVTLFYDQEKLNSFPDFFFEFKGAPLYDWRKDSTAGGDGDHRWNDTTTHEFTENPIVIEYNYRRGLSVNGDMFCGMGMPVSDLPLDKFTTAANICDELVDDEARYRCSILLDCMLEHGDNLKSIALSCGALQVDGVDGSWPIVGSDQPVAMEFTDNDIIAAADFKFRKYRSMGDLINLVSGNYPEPNQYWSMIGYGEQTSSDLVTLDRRTRDVNIDFPQVPSGRQAAQLAWIYLYENRFEATLNVTLRPRFQVLEVGDWVRWNSARYGTFVFIVAGMSLQSLDKDGPRNVVLELQQRDGSIYDGVTPPPLVIPSPPGAPVYASEVDGFGLVAVSVVGADGRAVPAIRASWGAILDPTVTDVEIRYFPTDQPEAVTTKTVRADVTVTYLSEGVVGNTEYTVQTKIITSPLRTTVFAAGDTVTTLNITVGLESLDAQIFATLGRLEGSLRDQIETINTRLNKMAMNTAARTWVDRQVVRRDLVSFSGKATAQISEVMTVATNTESALAELETSVSAQFDDQSASITEVSTAVADVSGFVAVNYSMSLNVNGYITGMRAYNGGPGLDGVIFTTTNFKIAIPDLAGSEIDVFQTGLVNGSTAVGIRGDLTIDGSIFGRSIAAGTITAEHIQVGSITGDRIEAGSINTEQLAVGSVDINVLIDGAATKVDQTPIGSFTAGAGTNITSRVVDIRSGRANITYSAAFNGSVNTAIGRPTVTVTLYVDGVSHKSWTWQYYYAGSNYELQQPFTVQHTVNDLSPGNHTFALYTSITTTTTPMLAGGVYITDLRR